jgi:hypothetical protein
MLRRLMLHSAAGCGYDAGLQEAFAVTAESR